MNDSINDNYLLMDYFDYSNLINAFEPQLAIVMIKTIWEKELGIYKLFEYEVSSLNVPDYKLYSFQDNESDPFGNRVYSFRNGWGCDRNEIDENMLSVVAQEFNAANSSTSLFLTLFDIYNSAVQNVCKIEVNIACNNSNGDFADEIMGLTIDEDILEMDSFDSLPCKFNDNKLIFDIDIDEENYHLEIPVVLKGTCVGNVFWNVFEIRLSEITRLINFLLDIGWSVSSAESSLYEACKKGEISEQDLELAFES